MEVKPKVQLLRYDDPLIMARAGRLCYSHSDITDLIKEMTEDKSNKLIHKLMNMGHHSPLEHISYTFGIEGISRAASHQIVRHRIASYSQQSQRYVKEKDFDYIVPPKIAKNKDAKNEYNNLMIMADVIYNRLINEYNMKPEDARFVLPNAAETKIIATYNARSLGNYFQKRLCTRAQWEIREVAKQMYKLVEEVTPYISKYMGASCDVKGYCPEQKMSCGRKETLEKLIGK